AGECDDLVEAARDLGAGHAENDAAHVYVLAAGELGVKAGADLQERCEAAVELGRAGAGAHHARENLEQRALAGAVATDDADDLAVGDLERDIVERAELFAPSAAPAAAEQIGEALRRPPAGADPILLGQSGGADGDGVHGRGAVAFTIPRLRGKGESGGA